MTRRPPEKPTIGWREWIALPGLGVRAIKVKVDTGARTSALHVFDRKLVRIRGRRWVRFKIHPLQRSQRSGVVARTPFHGRRRVRSSMGKEEDRILIRTEMELAGKRWPIEITLASRDSMGFRMILGREAIRGRFIVDPGKSYLAGVPAAKGKGEREGSGR